MQAHVTWRLIYEAYRIVPLAGLHRPSGCRKGTYRSSSEARSLLRLPDGRRKKDWSGLRSSPSCGQMRGGVSETDH
jgi:hypothetical protein